jgi:hypothetical protein
MLVPFLISFLQHDSRDCYATRDSDNGTCTAKLCQIRQVVDVDFSSSAAAGGYQAGTPMCWHIGADECDIRIHCSASCCL